MNLKTPHQSPMDVSELAAEARRQRHLRITVAAREAFADPAFQRDLADLKARCRSAPRPNPQRACCNVAFDTRYEREEGWAWEPIGNVFS